MKTISVKGVTYYLETEDELIDLAHQLAKEGYSIVQIAKILGVSERVVRKYMSECW